MRGRIACDEEGGVKMLTFGSLFAGIGGLDLGLERAGMHCAWQVEIDDYCNKVLTKHWPGVPKFRDVRSVGAHNLPAVDLICGGFPCQPHSNAGKRKGAVDDRDLWPEFARLVCELRPQWVLAENVPGLLSTDSGRFFGTILGELAALGYDAEWDCLPAAAVGAPHLRERTFIIAHAHDERRQEQHSAAVAATAAEYRGVFALNADSHQARRQSRADEEAAGRWVPNLSERFSGGRGPWRTEPDVDRVADGIPHRMDRLRGLGNAVVPQVAELIGRWIVALASTEQEQRKAA
jgi:DNA (cytosine-5)-methyltransferase 1